MLSIARITTSIRRAVPAALAAALLLAPAIPAAAAPADDPRAATFRSEAMSIVESTGDYAKAASHLVTTAMLMPEGDLDRATNLRLAGRLYHHAGELEKARFATLNAGVAAFDAGEPGMAAHIFLDAVEVAVEEGVPGAAESAAQRAGAALLHGDVSPAERKSVLDRIFYSETEMTGEPTRDGHTKG